MCHASCQGVLPPALVPHIISALAALLRELSAHDQQIQSTFLLEQVTFWSSSLMGISIVALNHNIRRVSYLGLALHARTVSGNLG